MNIPVKTVFRPKQVHRLIQQLHRVVGVFMHRRRQKQPLYVVTAVKADRQLANLLGRERRTLHVRAVTVRAIFTIKHAIVAH